MKYVFVIEYRSFSVTDQTWYSKISSEGYDSLEKAQTFIEGQMNEPSRQTNFYYQTKTFEEYYIHPVQIV